MSHDNVVYSAESCIDCHHPVDDHTYEAGCDTCDCPSTLGVERAS